MSACRECGCTDDDCGRCVARTGSPCWWIERDLCSACAPDQQHAHQVLAIESARRLATAQGLPGVIVVLLAQTGTLAVGLCSIEDPRANPIRFIAQLVYDILNRARAETGEHAVPMPVPAVALERARCVHCLEEIALTSDVDAIRHHSMTCEKSPVVQALAKARDRIIRLETVVAIDGDILAEDEHLTRDNEDLVATNVSLENELAAAIPTEPEKESLRWLRDELETPSVPDADYDARAQEALTVLRRLLDLKARAAVEVVAGDEPEQGVELELTTSPHDPTGSPIIDTGGDL